MPLNKALRQSWVEAGYPSDMGSAEVCLPPSADFVRAYHLLSSDHAINNLALGRLKVSRYADLNDPFELMAVNLKQRDLRDLVSKAKEELNQVAGIICFSSDWTNPVLWSHYGVKHHGVCLGFNLRKKPGPGGPVRVQYAEKRVEPDPHTPGALGRSLGTKFKHWEYEQEIRVQIPLNIADTEGALFFQPFNDDMQLAEVILGHRCTLDLNVVRKMVKSRYASAITFKARAAFGHFKIVPLETSVTSK